MKERPILFSAPMVRAILDGRKTMTRRVVKPMLYPDSHFMKRLQPGDRLWVKETFCKCLCAAQAWACYRAEDKPCGSHKQKWRPSIHMPRWASRITLEVTGVRVERLQDITEQDAVAEGAFMQGKVGDDPVSSQWTMTGEGWRYETAREAFIALWQSINAKRPGYSWEANPWAWVVEFKRLQAERGEVTE